MIVGISEKTTDVPGQDDVRSTPVALASDSYSCSGLIDFSSIRLKNGSASLLSFVLLATELNW